VISVIETQCVKNGKSEGFRGVSRKRRHKVSVRKNLSFVVYLDNDDDDENPSLILHERLFFAPLPCVCYSRLRGNEMRSFIYRVLQEEYKIF
jgi:hypothetical protein